VGRRQFVASAAALYVVARGGVRVDAASVYAETVLAKGPVGYWRLGELGGPAAVDSTTHGHDGTYRGDPVFAVPGAIVDDPDGAVQLDGRHDYVEISNSVHFSQPGSGRGLTVEAWMRPDALAFTGETTQNYVHWLGKGDAGDVEWGFRFYSSDSPSRPNRISAYCWNAAGGEGAGAYFQDVLEAGTWIYVVACYDPGDSSDPMAGVSIYRDGVLRESPEKSSAARYASYDVVPVHGAAPLRLGTRDLVSLFTGALDEVAIYPRVLSADEIAENYQVGSS